MTTTTGLYQQHYSEIRRYLSRFLSDALAEELAQDVFVKAHKGLKHFRGEASPRSWLYKIATNTLRDFIRSKSYRDSESSRTLPILEAELEQLESAALSEVSTEQGAIRNEMNSCITEFIHRLPESYSTVLVLSDIEGHKNREIAEILDLSLEAVKIRLHRARARLKQELSQGCSFSHNEENELTCQRNKT